MLDASLILAPSGLSVSFPYVYQIVKTIVRSGSVSDDVRSQLKAWLKQSDANMALASLTVSPCVQPEWGHHTNFLHGMKK